MCDTFVALADTTADGSVVFAKNSDREPNEGHELLFVPATDHEAGSALRCTYREVLQVSHTHAVLLAKPYWIWGAEMGANEHGVVIGNEAVFTKVPQEKEPGLIGMDLLRLGLERADTAAAAVEVITDLLHAHGQSGDCGHTHPLRYDNSFIVADPSSAWVLETAGREWAAKQVLDGARSISNAITLADGFDRSSDRLVALAVEHGWAKPTGRFDFGRAYSDRLYTRFSDAARRQCRTADRLAAMSGQVDVSAAIHLLQDHGSPSATADSGWSPARGPAVGLLGQSVCAHAGYGPVRISQTTGSWVSHLRADGSFTHWVTGTAAPCTSMFKPLWFDAAAVAGLPDTGPRPTGRYDGTSLWWRHEDLHRETLRDYAARLPHYAGRREELQRRFLASAAAAERGSVADRVACSRSAFAEADAAEAGWLADLRAASADQLRRGLFARAWRSFDRAAGRPTP